MGLMVLLSANLINKEVNAGKLMMRFGRAIQLNGLLDYHSRCIQRLPYRLMSSTFATQVKQERVALLELLPNFTVSIVKNPKFSLVPEASSWLQQLQTYFLIGDDILDGSSTRRGKPCWHTKPGVGVGALKDILMMHGSLFEILKVHFKEHPHYTDILDLFNEAILYTSIGEHLDYIMSNRTKKDYSLFTKQNYNSIVKHKAAYYTFKLPVLLGYLLANNSDGNLHRMVEEMCLDLGLLYQIQNDMLDIFGDESVTGKNGSDIQNGKCTWFAVHALRLSDDAQRAFFIENYANKDPAKVQNIKHLYQELNLLELYRKEETFLYKRIKEKASMLPINDRKLLLKLLNMIYKRKL